MGAFLLALTLSAQGPATAPASPIVVQAAPDTGNLDRQLLECRAGRCTPAQDANAALARANVAFATGDYETARAVLKASVGRVGKVGSAPKLYAALNQAVAIVAEHQGDTDDAIAADRRAVLALDHAAGVSAGDAIFARVETGDLLARSGRIADARNAYAVATRESEAAGLPVFAAAVAMRVAWLDYRGGYPAKARSRLSAMAETTDPSLDNVRIAAAIMLARIARDEGDQKPTEALLHLLAGHSSDQQPPLLYSPPLPSPTLELNDPAVPRQTAVPLWTMDRESVQWADVGYWIRPDGTVGDAEVLRGSQPSIWTRPVLKAISQRMYAKTETPGSPDGVYKVVRFSLGYPLVVPLGTLIPRRAGLGVISELDLARQDWPQTPSN